MKIAKMAKLDGASKYGSCMDCLKSIRSDSSSLKITFESDVSIMLCEKCWKKLVETHCKDFWRKMPGISTQAPQDIRHELEE